MTSIPSTLPIKAQPWLERSGKLSWLKLVVFVFLFVPGTLVAVRFAEGWLGPKPLTEAIHTVGTWTVRFLILSLAVTPLRRLTQWNKLLLVRRMLGIGALVYVLIHFLLYIVSLHFDLVRAATEIVLRFYLTIGFVALVGLAVLGATSTDAAIKRIGPVRWNRLHKIVYVLIALGLLHFFLQAKLDVTEPTLMTGLFVLLMGHRLLASAKLGDHVLALLGLAVGSSLITGLMEAGWYMVSRHIPMARVLQANFDFDLSIRPAWWVLLAGLGLVTIRLVRPLWSRRPPQGNLQRARTA